MVPQSRVGLDSPGYKSGASPLMLQGQLSIRLTSCVSHQHVSYLYTILAYSLYTVKYFLNGIH